MRQRIKIIKLIPVIAALAFTQLNILPALEAGWAEGEYFSYDKYAYTYLYFSRIERLTYSTDGLAERKIKGMADNIVAGFNHLNAKEPDKAIPYFRRGLRILPEYFHLDFILALTYEGTGDFKTAARYYKSYLDKLRKFHMGMFPITKRMIEDTVGFKILSYPEAEGLIKNRLALYGIDIDNLPAEGLPLVNIVFVFAALAAAGLFLFANKNLIKRAVYKTRARLSQDNDYWLCTYCGKENANINVKCYNCGKGHSE